MFARVSGIVQSTQRTNTHNDKNRFFLTRRLPTKVEVDMSGPPVTHLQSQTVKNWAWILTRVAQRWRGCNLRLWKISVRSNLLSTTMNDALWLRGYKKKPVCFAVNMADDKTITCKPQSVKNKSMSLRVREDQNPGVFFCGFLIFLTCRSSFNFVLSHVPIFFMCDRLGYWTRAVFPLLSSLTLFPPVVTFLLSSSSRSLLLNHICFLSLLIFLPSFLSPASSPYFSLLFLSFSFLTASFLVFLCLIFTNLLFSYLFLSLYICRLSFSPVVVFLNLSSLVYLFPACLLFLLLSTTSLFSLPFSSIFIFAFNPLSVSPFVIFLSFSLVFLSLIRPAFSLFFLLILLPPYFPFYSLILTFLRFSTSLPLPPCPSSPYFSLLYFSAFPSSLEPRPKQR